jgi:endogenous inhibitor of DNA gyrase (YacG/DUF329 family)
MSTDDHHKPEDELVIEELMEVKASGVPAGVCGREWCEVCGQEGSFSGFLGAMWAHTASGRFVCGGCLKGPMRTESNGANPLTLDRLIVERGFRYCGGCGQEVILSEPSVEAARSLPFTCPACHGLDLGAAARRRYLEHQATKKGGLERAAARIHWAKMGIEEMLGEED